MSCIVPVNYGEVYDKMSILRLKLQKISDEGKRAHAQRELDALRDATAAVPVCERLTECLRELDEVNAVLWDTEDELRRLEAETRFDREFVDLARNVYTTNDIRSCIKGRINALLGSDFHEVKSHATVESSVAATAPVRMLMVHHLGMGDHLVMNGFVRYHAAADRRQLLTLVCYDHYKETVQFMFRDVPGLVLLPIADGAERMLIPACQSRTLQQQRHCYVGLYDRQGFDTEDVFWKSFYVSHGLDPGIMRSWFKVIRNPLRENAFYERFVSHVGSDKYIVVHEDPSRQFLIDRTKVRNDHGYPCINIHRAACPVQSDNLFDYCKVIERAVAFHGFDSSFAWLVELCGIPVPAKYLHVYIKDVGRGFTSRAYGEGNTWVEVE